MLFSELHCWMKCPFLVSTWPVLKFYESLKFHCGTEWWHKTLPEKLAAIISPSPSKDCLSTRTEDISKLNKETFPANRKCSQLHNIFSLHIGPLKDFVCDNINTDSPGSAVMHEECGHESLRAGAAGYDQWGQILFCAVNKAQSLCCRLKRRVLYISRMSANSFCGSFERMMSQNSSK